MSERVECPLCPQHCQLQEGQTGLCKARGFKQGEIVSLTYGEVAAWNTDPIEKKPLFHFYPGSRIFSAGGFGCNLRCFFCQNHEISQKYEKGCTVSPEELAKRSLEDGSIGLCFTYSEPLVWYEMIANTAPLVEKQGGKVALVSNGIIEEKYLEDIIPYIDAVNIDIKGFTEDFYLRHTGGKLKWVLDTVERLAGRVHMEITTLVIPTLNDSPEEIESLACWLADLKVPLAWHLSRYHPMYKCDISATDIKKLEYLWRIAQEHLPYVYMGNVHDGNITYCPQCGLEVIIRNRTVRMQTKDGNCSWCGFKIWGQGLDLPNRE